MDFVLCQDQPFSLLSMIRSLSMRRLVTIAQSYNIAVVVTNHINTIPNSKEMFCRPIGGNAMGHAITYSVYLWTYNQSVYYATIVSSPYHVHGYRTFRIGMKGLEDN